MAASSTQIQGTRAPVKRPPSANSARTPSRPGTTRTSSSSAPQGIKTQEGFKFVAPVANQFAKDEAAEAAPSPFKKIDDQNGDNK